MPRNVHDVGKPVIGRMPMQVAITLVTTPRATPTFTLHS